MVRLLFILLGIIVTMSTLCITAPVTSQPPTIPTSKMAGHQLQPHPPKNHNDTNIFEQSPKHHLNRGDKGRKHNVGAHVSHHGIHPDQHTNNKTQSKRSSKSSSSSSGQTYTGQGTWFEPASEGGSEGACGGKAMNDNSDVVALNHDQYGDMNSKSSWCGKEILIKGPAGSTTAVIADACPGCGYGDLDLTPKVFEAVVGNMNIGVGKITWHVVSN